MEDSSSEGSDTDEEDEEVAPKRRQIFFCSRTHSQLSQFVSELHRTPFAETLSVVAIAGRKVRCSLCASCRIRHCLCHKMEGALTSVPGAMV